MVGRRLFKSILVPKCANILEVNSVSYEREELDDMVCKECGYFSKYYEALEYHQCRPVSRHLQIVKDLSRVDCLRKDNEKILSDTASEDSDSDNHELEKKMKEGCSLDIRTIVYHCILVMHLEVGYYFNPVFSSAYFYHIGDS